MKRKLVLLVSLAMSMVTQAQTSLKPFEDALTISHSLKSPGNLDFEEVLSKYIASGTTINSFVTSNIFLAEHVELNKAITTPKTAAANVINSTQSASSGYSFIPQHQAIDALGTFIAERFKQELNIAFLNKFRDKLKAQPDLQIMMPATYAFLLANEPYNYTSFLESLRASFKQDLEKIPANVLSFTRAHKAHLTARMSNDEYTGLIMGLEAINSFLKRSSSAQILLDVTGAPETSTITNNFFKFSVKLTNAAVTELTDKVSRDWYGETVMKEVLNNAQTRLLFLGLFYEKHKALFADPALAGKAEKLQEYMNQVYRSYTVINEYQDMLKGVRQMSGGKLSVAEVTEYANLTINATDELLNIDDIFGATFTNTLVRDQVIPYARRSLAIIMDIDEKEYASAFVNTLALTTDLLPANSPFKTEFVKYGNFAVSIVTAENSGAMVQALESAALPVGSYKIKRESFTNISLNAYAGGFFGMEYLKERGDMTLPDGVETSAWTAGFTVPIGVAFSFGSRADYDASNTSHADYRRFNVNNKERVLTGGSWSLLVSAIDLGAVTAFRLTNDKAETLPEVKFQNVLAPGAYIIRGFRKIPVSWGIGAQYGPQVRKIADLGSEQELISSWSARTFIAVDIPLINFFTRNEK